MDGSAVVLPTLLPAFGIGTNKPGPGTAVLG